MNNILRKIITAKQAEISNLKLTNSLKTKARLANHYSLLAKLHTKDYLTIISEYKRASPSKGVINSNVSPLDQANKYVEGGAGAISILTEQKFFKGSFDHLVAVSKLQVPILCKDFIIDEIQIELAYKTGADVILLIAAILPKNRLHDLYNYAKKRGLEVIIEINNLAELAIALTTQAKIIGINNRDLKTFTIDLKKTAELAPLIKAEDRYVISESGFKNLQAVEFAANCGADGILIGETLMKATDCKAILAPLTKVYKRAIKYEN